MQRDKVLNSTLDQLEGVTWGAPEDSHLVTTCHRLRTVPLGTFSVEDLRLMIGQQVGLAWLVPLPLDAIERDPLVEGDFHIGDLLVVLLRLGCAFWRDHAQHRQRLTAVAASVDRVPDEVAEELSHFVADVG